LADKHHSLIAQAGPEGTVLTVPLTAPDAVSSTIVLKIKDSLDIEQPVLGQRAGGTLVLPASDARPHGEQLRYESGHQRDNLGFWVNPADWADWEFAITKPGRFEVAAEIAAPEAASLEVDLKGQKISSAVPVTGDYGDFKWTTIGSIEIQGAGKMTLSLHGIKEGWHPVNVKAIRLTPVLPAR